MVGHVLDGEDVVEKQLPHHFPTQGLIEDAPDGPAAIAMRSAPANDAHEPNLEARVRLRQIDLQLSPFRQRIGEDQLQTLAGHVPEVRRDRMRRCR